MSASITRLIDLTSKIAVVTGGARGIGEGIVRTLAEAGAHVVIGDVLVDQAKALEADVRAHGLLATSIELDVADDQSVKALADRVVSDFKRIDILVNNAGVFPFKNLQEIEPAVWNRTIQVNLGGTFLCTKRCADKMIAGGVAGRIINISSVNTACTYVGMPHYDASKAGIEALTRSSALEYAPFGITANAVAPGGVLSPGARSSMDILASIGGGSAVEAEKQFAQKVPLKRWAEPADIGYAVLCFAAPGAAYITGQTLYVDGGLILSMY